MDPYIWSLTSFYFRKMVIFKHYLIVTIPFYVTHFIANTTSNRLFRIDLGTSFASLSGLAAKMSPLYESNLLIIAEIVHNFVKVHTTVNSDQDFALSIGDHAKSIINLFNFELL